MGFRSLVSLLPAIQATRLLAFALAGLSPAERASLRWTHFRTAGFPRYGSKAGLSDGACPCGASIQPSSLRINVPDLQQPPSTAHLTDRARDAPADRASARKCGWKCDRTKLFAVHPFKPDSPGLDAFDCEVVLNCV